MKTPLQLLDDIQVASPCSVAWEQMAGTDRVRHCSECDQRVYDISSLSAHEAVRLLEASGSNLCVRLYRRSDGKIITRDCVAVRATKQLRRVVCRTGLAVASFFGVTFAIAGCGDESRQYPGSGEQRLLQGKVACPPIADKENLDEGPKPIEK